MQSKLSDGSLKSQPTPLRKSSEQDTSALVRQKSDSPHKEIKVKPKLVEQSKKSGSKIIQEETAETGRVSSYYSTFHKFYSFCYCSTKVFRLNLLCTEPTQRLWVICYLPFA